MGQATCDVLLAWLEVPQLAGKRGRTTASLTLLAAGNSEVL